MEIQVKNSTVLSPAEETPKHILPNSPLDEVAPAVYSSSVYFYRRPNDSSDFFQADLLKEALSKVLVSFYPLAGRLRKNENGGHEVECNGEGILFVEAETRCVIDDFSDFSQGLKLLQLVPIADDTKDVTHFKCGGVCLGVRMHHILADAIAAYFFINAWATLTRGLPITTQPLFDRTILGAGVPTSPTFHHTEYDTPPSMSSLGPKIESQSNPGSICTAILRVSLDQMSTLKEKSRSAEGSTTIKYSRFEILAAHIWRCVCKARGLSDDQASKLHFPTNGRSRLNPPLPYEYFGNVTFITALTALAGEIQSESLHHTVKRIHEALILMNDEYLKSALAYLKQPDLTIVRRGAHTYKCPNLNIVNLMQMPMYEVYFGWGKPIFTRVVNAFYEGQSHILPSPTNDGSLLVSINLENRHMENFKKLFYEIFLPCHSTRSRY